MSFAEASKHRSTKSKLSWLENRNLVSTLKINNLDVDITIETGADASMLTETSSAMLGLQLQKVNCQLGSANGIDLNVVGASDIWIDSAYISANSEISMFMLLNLLAVL